MFIAGIGRDAGIRQYDQGGKRIYSIGNFFHNVDLTEEEYILWKDSRKQTDVQKWVQEFSEKHYFTPDKLVDYIVYLKNKNLIWDGAEFSGWDDSKLRCYQVVKNGQITTKDPENDRWIWTSVLHPLLLDGKQQVNFLTDDLYMMWRCASGATSIPDVIRIYQELYGCSLAEARNYFATFLPYFHSSEMWTIEYIPEGMAESVLLEEYNQTKESSLFQVKHLKKDTKLIAIGEELGVASMDFTDERNYIHLGKEIGVLSAVEYPIWFAIRSGCQNINQISKLYDVSIQEVTQIVSSLMKKKMVMIWPKGWSFSDEMLISFHPTGSAVGAEETNYQLQSIRLSTPITIPILQYAVWLSSHALLPLSIVRDQIVQSYSCSQQIAAQIVSDSIPFLIQNQLGHLLFTPYTIDADGEA